MGKTLAKWIKKPKKWKKTSNKRFCYLEKQLKLLPQEISLLDKHFWSKGRINANFLIIFRNVRDWAVMESTGLKEQLFCCSTDRSLVVCWRWFAGTTWAWLHQVFSSFFLIFRGIFTVILRLFLGSYITTSRTFATLRFSACEAAI